MKTSTERNAALRARRKEEGLAEVRNVWAPPDMHDELRESMRKKVDSITAKRAGK